MNGPKSIGGYPVSERLCEAKTKKGRPCRNHAVAGKQFCPSHFDPEKPTGTPSPRFADAVAALPTQALEQSVGQKPYRGTVHVTIMAKDKREAKKALASVGGPIGGGFGPGPEIRVDCTEGPEEVDIPNN